MKFNTSICILSITLSVFSFSCKKEEKPANLYPAIFEFQSGETPLGMAQTPAGDFIIQLNQSFGSSSNARHILFDVQHKADNPIMVSMGFSMPLFVTPNFRGSVLFDKQRNTAVAFGITFIDTLSYVALQDMDTVLNTTKSVFYTFSNFYPGKIMQVNDGYLLLGTGKNGFFFSTRIVKFDKQLQLKWDRLYESARGEEAIDAVQFCDGTTGVLTHARNIVTGLHDMLLLKLNANGDTIATKMFVTNSHYNLKQIVATGTCDYFIAGSIGNAGSATALAMGINQNLDKIWEKIFPSERASEFTAITSLPGGKGVLAAGRTFTYANGNGGRLLIVAVDANGNELWRKIRGDGFLDDIPLEVAANSEFYYLLCERLAHSSASFMQDYLE